MEQISYAKVGTNRGKRRIWIGGKKLNQCGFTHGTKYVSELDLKDFKITLKVAPEGNKKVSGKAERPVIDLCNNDITTFAARYDKVRIILKDGLIEITPSSNLTSKEDRENRAKSPETPTMGSVCSGAGIGTKALGFVSEWVIDRERKYLNVAEDQNDIQLVIEGDLEDVEVDLVPSVDIMNVSLACTGHSKAGKSKHRITFGEQHPTDATAVISLCELIKAVNPSVIVSENVTEARDSASYMLLKGYLTRLGYNISEMELNGKDAGTIEQRTRYWFVATSTGLPAFDPETVKTSEKIHTSLAAIAENVPDEDPRWKEFTYLADKEVKDIAAGKGFRRQLKSLTDTEVGTIGRGYAKCRSSEPFIKHEDGIRSRLLTPKEHARVKRIPEQFVDGISVTLAHEILGQSILWTHAEAIGMALKEWFNQVKGREVFSPV